ncbi:uncharacterized protein PG998_014338, partial [Apiospora kogelbergensis]|uniref:uncharacterized protein n=1 Tax=Apiospora kogelbergensis TaxID=1337665 RepID=UPI00312E437C
APGAAAAPATPGTRPPTGPPAANPPTPGAKPATLAPGGADPIIVTLAEKASEDPHLRDLMKRVARIIDQITADYKKRGGQQGPSADRLIVDGRTVQYFADEVDAILGIVLKSNAKQKEPISYHLRAAILWAPGRKGSVASTPQTPTGNSQQALRSKGPPPNLKPYITGIVFEFHGGTGDRYLFPKFSILEYQAGGSQVLATFLLVRKGSKSEYGGDPALDYYQPITIRLQATSGTGKHLENLARVVAPQDEVKRYMDDIMSNMTRAEYILLAMRLPRHDEEDADDRAETPKLDQQ